MLLKAASTASLITLVLALGLGGCSKKEGDKPTTQVVAKVNGTEISLHQVNHLLGKAGTVPPGQLERARKAVVDRLIDQELLAAKAVEEKLDRTPETLMAIEMARREILARARIEQLLSAANKLGPGDVTRYYGAHPELFSERQVYNLQEIVFPPQKDGLGEIKALVDKGVSMSEIQEFLKSRNIQFAGNSGVRAAEQVPLEFLKTLHKAKEGQMFLTSSEQGNTIVKVVGLRRVPADEATASPAIRKFLSNQLVAETSANELKALRGTAKIEYVGSLADASKADATQPQVSGAPAASLPALPQMDQLPIDSAARGPAK